jgi:NADH-quinone oxidoreductase subunit G
MIEIELDGQKLDVAEGCTVMHAAEKAGTYIPHFCYHKKLSIAANCRMCLVDIEKMPKPMPACATPVTQGMIVRTKSDKAVKAQKSVMEFLLVNHPLDCPICDQGGECQLQDLAVGYGGSSSRYEEEKRVVFHKNIGPLVSMEEMSRCIHCTRCVRFGQEVAGVMELGMSNRGEHSEIEAFVGATVDSELSGNMIDVCPVGALTSKPFRYSARTWELSRRKSISPHDSTGANVVVQVKNGKVMRVVPSENEAVNECWIADRDRFSYEALNSPDRLTSPMIKQDGKWASVDWQTALEYVAAGLKDIGAKHTPQSLGALVSPHSTVEELYLAGQLMRGLGSHNVDYRQRHANYSHGHGARWLGRTIASLTTLDRVLVIGSNLRKDHPLFAQRIRQAARHGAAVHVVTSNREFAADDAWAMRMGQAVVAPASQWLSRLAAIAAQIAQEKGVDAPQPAQIDEPSKVIAKSLLTGERKAILLGNAAAHAINSEAILRLANWIATQTGATVGYLTEAANTVGAQLVGALPDGSGLNVGAMIGSDQTTLKGMLLLNTEPEFDSRFTHMAAQRLAGMKMVVGLTPFKTNLDACDVLLPITPFTETSGSFVNAEGRLQSFHAVVKPLGDARPAWKVLRVLASMFSLAAGKFESSHEVLAAALPGVASGDFVAEGLLSNAACDATLSDAPEGSVPCVASIYQLDGLVRRATSLQLTADAKRAATEGQVTA